MREPEYDHLYAREPALLSIAPSGSMNSSCALADSLLVLELLGRRQHRRKRLLEVVSDVNSGKSAHWSAQPHRDALAHKKALRRDKRPELADGLPRLIHVLRLV